MTDLVALFLAGLSLFFTGVASLSDKLQKLSSRQFRRVLSRLTDAPLRAALVGVAFGALTQSASAVAFLVAGMVATGMITLRRALPVVAAANVGTAVLVFLAAFDLRLAILFLIGVSGLMISFKVAARYEVLFSALFAIGLLFLGLDLMKRAFEPLPTNEWFRALVGFLKEWTLAPFLIGAACRMVIQSSAAIGVLAITLEHSGLLSERQAVLLIFGAGPGAALSTYFLSATLQGVPRQIALYQGIINAVAGCALAALILVDGMTGNHVLPTELHASTPAVDSGSSSGILAWAYFATMGAAMMTGLALLPFAERLLNRLSPPTFEEDLSRPQYLQDEMLAVPDAALDLADNEQRRLFTLVVATIDSVRSETRAAGAPDPEALVRAGADLGAAITSFLGHLIDGDLAGESAVRLLLLDRRQDHLTALLETTGELAAASSRFSEGPAALVDRLKEALSLILLATDDAWNSHAADDVEVLLRLTADRGDLMERLRRSVSVGGADSAETSTLLYLTSLFERAVWLVRQIGLSLRGEEREELTERAV